MNRAQMLAEMMKREDLDKYLPFIDKFVTGEFMSNNGGMSVYIDEDLARRLNSDVKDYRVERLIKKLEQEGFIAKLVTSGTTNIDNEPIMQLKISVPDGELS